jgi:HAD superfamily hydrolase (TIGR01509 family)
LATRKLNVKPEDCIFMDDSPPNVESADKLGMKTVLWENLENGFEEFTQLLK